MPRMPQFLSHVVAHAAGAKPLRVSSTTSEGIRRGKHFNNVNQKYKLLLQKMLIISVHC